MLLVLIAALVALAAAMAVMMSWPGCAGPQARQGTVEVATEVVTHADIDTAVQTIVKAVDLSQQQAAQATQQAKIAIQKIDQSNSDKVVNRGLMTALATVAILLVVAQIWPHICRWRRQRSQRALGRSMVR